MFSYNCVHHYSMISIHTSAMERTDLLQSRDQMEPAGKPKFEMINVEQLFESPQEIHNKQIGMHLFNNK